MMLLAGADRLII